MQVTSTPRLTLITLEEARAHLQLLYEIRRKAVDKIGDHALRSESPYITNPVNYLRDLITRYELSEVHLGIQEPKWSSYDFRASYLELLGFLKKQFNLKPNIVYAPGHGNDISHIATFYDSKEIISLEINPDQVNTLRSLFSDEPNVKCFLGSAEDFVLEEKADLLLLIAAGFDQQFSLSQLKQGGYVVCNNSSLESSRYSEIRKDLEFIAKAFSDSSISTNRSEGEKQVETDAELKRVKDSRHLTEGRYVVGELKNLASYADVLKVVYFATGQTTNIVQRYKEVREAAIENEIELSIRQIKERHASPERIADVDELCRQNENWKRSDFEWSADDYLKHSEDLRKKLNRGVVKTVINRKELELKPLPKKAYETAYIYKKL